MLSVYEEILAWSAAIPLWQRDALRRLALGSLTADDNRELLECCLSDVGLHLPDSKDVPACPLEAKHLPAHSDTAEDVTLHAIDHVNNVNLLDATAVLSFAPQGLTAIYGNNGSGKSGYVRILKRICRARDGGEAIHPSIFAEPSTERASAVVAYAEGDKAPARYDWTDDANAEPPDALSRVSVFDAKCGALYVSKDSDTVYRPFGLDLFDQLAQVARDVRDKIDEEIASRPSTLPQMPDALQNQEFTRKHFPLTAKTDVPQLLEVAQISPDEAQEITALERTLGEDSPSQQAAALRRRKAVLGTLLQRVNTICNTLGVTSLSQANGHMAALNAAIEADRLAREEAFAGLLPETGGNAWKLLWSHAREFSAMAYPGNAFPNTNDDAMCLLCQQPLSDEAKERFSLFETYIKAETAAAVQSFTDVVAADVLVVTQIVPKDDMTGTALQELAAESPEVAEKTTAFLDLSTTARDQVLSALRDLVTIPIEGLTFDTSGITNITDKLEAEAAALVASEDVEELQKATTRLLDLKARQWAQDNAAAIQEESHRLGIVSLLDSARKLTDTTAISRKASDLTSEHVTAHLQTRIEQELRRVGPQTLGVEIVPRAQRGVTSHKVRIRNAKLTDVPVDQVLSEGEFRSVALATFLAELSQSPCHSALVVDDPACSMDHLHRRHVADRLADEAQARQVVVFTHDLVFLNDVIEAAKERSVSLAVRHVTRSHEETGRVSEDLPWYGKPASKRIGVLKNDLHRLTAFYKQDPEAYQEPAKVWYGRLRETWERAVEEVLLNSVVLRFSRAVQTNRLKKIAGDVTKDDFDRIEAGMSKASTWLPGHDQPKEVNAPVPAPDELAKDLADLESYIEELRKRGRPV